MIIVLLGPPGSGKGTQGDRLSQRLGVPRIATGDLLREAVRAGTALGLEAKKYMDRGDLVPDEVILGIVREVFASQRTRHGAILDGVVRTVPQAEGLSTMLVELGRRVDVVLVFEIEDERLVQRLSSRVVCDRCQTPYRDREPGGTCDKCGGTLVRRPDDEPEAVRNRLRVYKEQTEPVIEWYEERLKHTQVLRIDADGSLDEVTERAMQAVDRR